MQTLFWTSLLLVFYTYLGYGIILYFLIYIQRQFKGKRITDLNNYSDLPACTLLIAAYNEEEFIEQKIRNSFELDYPEDKIKIVVVTDGSDDKTVQIVRQFPTVELLHEEKRKGKVAAVHRAVELVKTDIIVFTDANILLNNSALINIARHYSDPKVGAVAGEKRIRVSDEADAGTAGEGFYWRYESLLKKWDSELYSVVGAAGELYSIRTELYNAPPENVILDDFFISMSIASRGVRIIYEPEAYALENASDNIREELKRKVRIAAGGIQSIILLSPLLNIFKFGLLSFQYISHRVLRWTIAPILLIPIFFTNLYFIFLPDNKIFLFLFAGQILFYLMAFTGWLLEKRELRIKILFIPYYFCIMNYAILAGFYRYFVIRQSVLWDKAKRRINGN